MAESLRAPSIELVFRLLCHDARQRVLARSSFLASSPFYRYALLEDVAGEGELGQVQGEGAGDVEQLAGVDEREIGRGALPEADIHVRERLEEQGARVGSDGRLL